MTSPASSLFQGHQAEEIAAKLLVPTSIVEVRSDTVEI